MSKRKDGGDARAERRRKALTDFMKANDLRAGSWARMAGLKNANAIYNFLSGDSESLRQETYERLAQAIPGTTIAQLTGERAAARPALSHIVPIKIEAEAGVLRLGPELSLEDQVTAAFPEGSLRAQGAFGVRLLSDDMDMAFPAGSLIVCQPLAMRDRPLRSGNYLLVRRWLSPRKCETLLRELRLVGRKEAWLWPRSTRPEFQAPTQMPWPYDGSTFEADGQKTELAGVAIGAYLTLQD